MDHRTSLCQAAGEVPVESDWSIGAPTGPALSEHPTSQTPCSPSAKEQETDSS